MYKTYIIFVTLLNLICFKNRHKLGNNYEYEGEFYRKL